jgi:hypothetical protein
MKVLKKLKIEHLYDMTISFGYISKANKSSVIQKHIYCSKSDRGSTQEYTQLSIHQSMNDKIVLYINIHYSTLKKKILTLVTM